MQSHTVPRKLLEHFAYDELITKSKRLWRYQKERPPYGRAAPISATRWDGHFADPEDARKEAEIEARLNKEFEHPVNQFIDVLHYETFPFEARHSWLLTGYITMLFHRTRARRATSDGQENRMIDALRGIRANEEMLARLVAKQTMDMIPGGLRHMLSKEDLIAAIDNTIAEHSKGDVAQRGYVRTMQTMMAFDDEGMRHGEWRILRTPPEKPFVIGDAPVVTWERKPKNLLLYGQGFAKPNVEVILPIFPTACMHVLPAVQRTMPVRVPTVEDVNIAQAIFATEHCFTNIKSTEIDAMLQPHFGRLRLGIEGFSLAHTDPTKQLFQILMSQQGAGVGVEIEDSQNS